MKYLLLLSLVFLGLFASIGARAAPCCAGGGSFLSLLNEEEKRQMTLSFSTLSIEADAPADGRAPVARYANDTETRNRWELSWAELLSDRWQVGAVVPVGRRIRVRGGREGADAGLGDIQASVGYEYLPEWSYSSWKPRGVLYSRVTAPTGVAPWDAVAPYSVDSHGAGFWKFGVGTYFSKVAGSWDWFVWADIQKGLPTDVRKFLAYRLNPGLEGTFGGSIGYSFGDLRLGVTLGRIWESDMEREGLATGTIPGTTFSSASVSLGYLISPVASLSLQYADQILLGGASNAALGRSLGLILRTRWERD